MSQLIRRLLARLGLILGSFRGRFSRPAVDHASAHPSADLADHAPGLAQACLRQLPRVGRLALGLTLVGGLGYGLYTHPPLAQVQPGEVGVRLNLLSGERTAFREGAVLVVPGLHSLRTYSLRSQVYHPKMGSRAGGDGAFQSVEGLSLGIDLSVRYALDPDHILQIAQDLPPDLDTQVIAPTVQGVAYRILSRYTVKEIFSTRRQDIQEEMDRELRGRLARDGIRLESVTVGKVDLPREYQAGMERLLAEELASEKMRYTLELKEKGVQQSALEADADKIRRQKEAEAAANEQIIAAQAQAEAMKHILPFKQKQIEQRGLEAEAEKVARLKMAEANAQARRIEAAGEADSRQKLADAEAYRLERLGKVASEQMAREGALLSRNPLLIQKTMADKLSDKVSVIIAPTPSDGGFIGAALLGAGKGTNAVANVGANPGANPGGTGALPGPGYPPEDPGSGQPADSATGGGR